MTEAERHRYMPLTLTYLILGGIVGVICALFFGVMALVVSGLSTLVCFALAMRFMRETFTTAASKFWEQEVATTRQTVVIALVGLPLLPLLIIANALIFAAIIPADTEPVMGTLLGAVFAGVCGVLAARYAVCARAPGRATT